MSAPNFAVSNPLDYSRHYFQQRLPKTLEQLDEVCAQLGTITAQVAQLGTDRESKANERQLRLAFAALKQQQQILLTMLRGAGLDAPSRMSKAARALIEEELRTAAPSPPARATAPTPAVPPPSPAPSIGRNAPCPCASGRKYKQCCGKGAPRQTLNL